MIRHGLIVRATDTNPYRNIALEAWLLENVPAETCVLYLWQNHRTVVIGRNQNAWAECRVEDLERDGGFLARRLSGGGAVFHDSGNLNFTFLAPREDYDLERQSSVILNAVRGLGIDAKRTGRNDIEAEGRKFSGNAFYHSGSNAYHHGTLLVNADLDAAGRYLSASTGKFQGKGVKSVRSRIVNLADFRPGLGVEALAESLCDSFDGVYGFTAKKTDAEALFTEHPEYRKRLVELEARFSRTEWNYGKNPCFSFTAARRFDWGGVEIRLDVKQNRIADAQIFSIADARIFSDAMDGDFIIEAAARLKGADFNSKTLTKKLLSGYPAGSESWKHAGDIAAMIFEETCHGKI
jgi:lipoate-protein ligase A